jgi:ribosomal protein S12 methylthiotransferase accessory factor
MTGFAQNRPPHSRLPADVPSRYSFGSLVQPYVGLIDGVRFLPLQMGEPEIEVAAANLGNVSMVHPIVATGPRPGGAGSDINPELAWLRAVVEAAERYACMVFSERDAVIATALDLGSSDALDLDELPRCSAAEYKDPKCPLIPPRKDVPIRWVRGYSLVHQRERLVPAVMTHLHLHSWDAERFWLQISTGVAAHTSLTAALVSAICESIERDAVALMWLGRLPLPKIEYTCPGSSAARAIFDRVDASGIRFCDFEATTNLRIPTVFSVQLAPKHPYCSLSVSCATALDPAQAQLKAMREACSARLILNKPEDIPASVADFYDITHGAHYFGLGGHQADFDFLLNGRGPTTTIAAMNTPELPAPGEIDSARLGFLLKRLQDLGMDAIAVDLSTDELRDAGLWVVRVIIPQLMPISFVHRARYLGTPRLYDYVGCFHHGAFTEANVNPAPLPFA